MSAIELRGLRKSYGDIEAVRGIDIAIEAGETVALLGPNGAGKSTTIDMILGLAEPDAGTVSVLGGPPAAAIDSGWIGAMLQTGALIRDLSVGELVAMVASLYPQPLDVHETLELTGLADIAEQRTQKLSGGQTQRVRFAVALVSNPKLLVLDEPTVAMDVEGRHSFWTTMREQAARGRTILFATHYLEEAGTMSAMLSSGARISAERAVGWNRQLRISPLTTRAYFRAKVLTAYMTAILTMIVLYASGLALGVSMPAGDWVRMTLLILVCLIPFAALGITIGHMLTPDSIGPAMGGGVALLAFLGGTWFPIPTHGFLYDIGQLLPSYWLVQASHIALGAHPWPAKAWVVIVAWTVVLVALARRAYRRDTGRV